MPGFDQTGPMGQGPMTGRKMGRCAQKGAGSKNQDSLPTENPSGNVVENMNGMGYGRRGKGKGMRKQNRFRGGQS